MAVGRVGGWYYLGLENLIYEVKVMYAYLKRGTVYGFRQGVDIYIGDIIY